MKMIQMILALSLSSLVMSASARMDPGPGADADIAGFPCMEAGKHGDPQKMKERIGDCMAKRAQVVHDKLNLNSDQEVAWKAMETAMKPPADRKRLDIAEMEKLTAPERMEKMIEQMKLHEETMGVRLNAVKEFYAKLSLEQQKTFDKETLAPWKKLGERAKARHAAAMHGDKPGAE